MLQTRAGKAHRCSSGEDCSGYGKRRAKSLRDEAILRVDPEQLDTLLHKTVGPNSQRKSQSLKVLLLLQGLPWGK